MFNKKPAILWLVSLAFGLGCACGCGDASSGSGPQTGGAGIPGVRGPATDKAKLGPAAKGKSVPSAKTSQK